jgi:hypothetical protein
MRLSGNWTLLLTAITVLKIRRISNPYPSNSGFTTPTSIDVSVVWLLFVKTASRQPAGRLLIAWMSK